MRPVLRGDAPKNAHGDDIPVQDYTEAKPELLRRLGPYCSYCERYFAGSLHIEHKLPREHNEPLALDWGNLLLSCGNCNSCKGHDDIHLDDYYWPDSHNTARAFRYTSRGAVEPADGLDDEKLERAQATLRLLGLDKHPGGTARPTDVDGRSVQRRHRWGLAEHFHRLFEAGQTDIDTIAVLVADRGFLSVWMTVFRNHPAVLKRLIAELPGTDPCCFEKETGQPKDAIDRPWIGDQ